MKRRNMYRRRPVLRKRRSCSIRRRSIGTPAALNGGLGVAENMEEAFAWYERAAQLGDAQAQCRLGDACRDGERGESDERAAFKWYLQAAELGFPPAMEYVGGCFLWGQGVKPDAVQAAAMV